MIFTQEDFKVIKNSRETYGNKVEVTVAAEECCELAQALLKYMRYNNHDKAVAETKDSVIEEMADVMILFNSIIAIYGITTEEFKKVKDKKIARLDKWLSESSSIQHTTEVRD